MKRVNSSILNEDFSIAALSFDLSTILEDTTRAIRSIVIKIIAPTSTSEIVFIFIYL